MSKWNRWSKLLFLSSSFAIAAQTVELPAQPYYDNSCCNSTLEQCRGIFLGAVAGAVAGYSAARVRRGKRGPLGHGLQVDRLEDLNISFTHLLSSGSATRFNIFVVSPYGTENNLAIDSGTSSPLVLHDIPAVAPKPVGTWSIIVQVLAADGAPEQLGTIQFGKHDPVTIPSAPRSLAAGETIVEEFFFPYS